jgi:hypothetical protein
VAAPGTRRTVIAIALVAACAGLWLAGARPRGGEPAPGPALHRAARAPSAPTSSAIRSPRAGTSGSDAPSEALHAQTSEQARARLAQRALEQRTRNDARHSELSSRWASETRDEPWSTDQERALRVSATASGLDHLLFELECRRTLCRVEISAADSNTAFALQQARAFMAQLGTDLGSTMTGGGLDRALEVFAARDGMGSPKGP